tara:strand:- start:5060 stop:6001 length:942 start_codon:yes stop_codon:yes gene_type:complete
MKENKDLKILVTGGSGLVGKHLKDILPNATYLSSKDADLTRINEVYGLIVKYKPDVVVHLAARVGGILDNVKHPVNYLEENIMMNANVLKACHDCGVEKVIAILSTCIFPDVVDSYPMKESQLFDGPPTPSNFSYGLAKRCMAAHIDSYVSQYNKAWSYLIPCNLYGEYDKYTEHNSHFVSALIKKIHDSVDNKITLWGDGTPMRQFMYGGDLARVIKTMIEKNIIGNFNVAPEGVLTIDGIAQIAKSALGKNDLKIEYDLTKPNGQYRKDVDSSKLLEALNGFEFTPLHEGIEKTYNKIKGKDPLFRVVEHE